MQIGRPACCRQAHRYILLSAAKSRFSGKEVAPVNRWYGFPHTRDFVIAITLQWLSKSPRRSGSAWLSAQM